MAPSTPPVSSQLQVHSHLVGRLIGKGGSTIKELECLTGCRVQVSTADRRAEDSLIQISVYHIASAKSSEREVEEARCARAAQLLMDGSSLFEALAQASAELEAQKQLDTEADARREESEAVHRIRMEWPEFDIEDVRAAVSKAGVMFQDDAIEMLLNGFHAPRARPARTDQNQDPEPEDKSSKRGKHSKARKTENVTEQEEFPALPNQAPAQIACSTASTAIHLGCRVNRWSQKRISRGSAGSALLLASVAEFPVLPTQLQKQGKPRPVVQRYGMRTLQPF